MTASFDWLMRRMPQIMVVCAVLFYLSSVISSVAANEAIRSLTDDYVPVVAKLRAVVLIFFQPLVPALLLAAGAAALWRFDRWWAARLAETAA